MNEKFQNEQREECNKKGWEPLLYSYIHRRQNTRSDWKTR